MQPSSPASVPPMSNLGQRAAGRAQAALARGDLAAAAEYAGDAKAHDPRHPDVWLVLAQVADARGEAAPAEEALSRALALAEGYGPALNARGVWRCRQQRWSDAQADFAAALLDPGYRATAQVLVNAGVCALETPDLPLAETMLRQALALSPRDPLALISMAKLEVERGNGLAARAFLQRREALGTLSAGELPIAIAVEALAGDARARTRYEDALRAALDASADPTPPSLPGGL
jgi:type IV pilus assembly protein PilF